MAPVEPQESVMFPVRGAITGAAPRTRVVAGGGLAAVVFASAVLPLALGRQPDWTVPSGTCDFQLEKVARPPHVDRGEPISLTLHLDASCFAPSNAAIVVDGAFRDPGDDGTGALSTQELQRFVTSLLFARESFAANIGAVGRAAQNQQLRCPITIRQGDTRFCLRRATAGNVDPTALVTDILAARVIVRNARHFADDRRFESVIIVSDGRQGDACSPVFRAAAQEVQSEGITVGAICISDRCDQACLRQWTSAPELFAGPDKSAAAGRALLREILHATRQYPHPPAAVITDVLSWEVGYVPGSAQPEPDEVVPSTNWWHGPAYVWRFDEVPAGGVTASLTVLPVPYAQAVGGSLFTNWDAEVSIQGVAGYEARATATVNRVYVGPTPRPTRTPTMTRPIRLIYLPLLSRDA
jgi:hypothetical protein